MNAPLDPDSDSQLPRWFGDYVLLKRLGKGGMGQVFLARSPGVAGIDRLCVIKTLRSQWTNDREYVARFVDEARVVVQLNHRNICPVFDVGQVRNTYYLAMDLVPGRDVQALMDRCALHQVTLPIDLSLLIVGEILEALDAAHRLRDPETDAPLNLVHRDVSPHNALISFDGEVKLIDFGLAHSALKQERTEPGVVLGKLAYMAPEHARGDVVDRRADLFAVGVMLYELAAGERYWADFTMQQIWQVVGQGLHRPPRLASLPPEIAAVIEKATAPNVKDRYSTGAEMRAAISQVQLARGVIASSADLRMQMESLFEGEALVDRRERAALTKLPAPGGGAPAPNLSSTRIARAPGASSSPGQVLFRNDSSPTLTDLPAPTDMATPATPAFDPDNAPTHETKHAVDSTDSDDQATELVLQRPKKSAPPPAGPDVTSKTVSKLDERQLVAPAPQKPRRLVAVVALVAVLVGVAIAVSLSGDDTNAAATLPPVTQTTPPTPPAPAPAPAPVLATPTPTPPPPAPNPPPKAEPVEATPTPPTPPPVPVRIKTKSPTPEPPVAAPPPPPAPPPEPWPSSWPRTPEGKQQLLRERCAKLACAARLVESNPKSLSTASLSAFQTEATACLETCKSKGR